MNHQFSRHYEHPARSFFSLKVALHGGRNGGRESFSANDTVGPFR